MVLLSGIAGVRWDADVGPFDCIAATSCTDDSVQEVRPNNTTWPSFDPLGPTTPGASRFKSGLSNWSSRLLSSIDSELARLGVVAPLRNEIIDEKITAQDQELQKKIKEALTKHAERLNRQFIMAKVCSGTELHKSADYLQRRTGHDKELWIVEMEFAGVFRACEAQGVPCLMTRAVSDLVGYEKEPGWTKYAAFVAAAEVKALLFEDGFWEWVNYVDRIGREQALKKLAGDGPGKAAAEAFTELEELTKQEIVPDPQRLTDAVKRLVQLCKDGYITPNFAERTLAARTEVCSGCGFGVHRAQLLAPLVELIARSARLQTPDQILVLVNAARLALIEGRQHEAQQLFVRTEGARVQKVFRSLPVNRRKIILQTSIELNGIDNDAGYLLRLLAEDEFGRGSSEAAGALRCLACKAASVYHAGTSELIEAAREFAAAIKDDAERHNYQKSVEAIAVFYDLALQTQGDWERLRGDETAKSRIDQVRQMQDGTWKLRHAESAFLAWLAFIASGDAQEASRARLHLAAVRRDGKATHCLFDLPAFVIAIEKTATLS